MDISLLQIRTHLKIPLLEKIAIMKYFDAVVVSMVMLTEPIVATLIGLAVGVSELPRWVSTLVVIEMLFFPLGVLQLFFCELQKTWAGDAVVMAGR